MDENYFSYGLMIGLVIIQIPVVIDLILSASPNFPLRRIAQKYATRFVMFLMFVILFVSLYLFFNVYLPFNFGVDVYEQPAGIVTGLIGLWLWMNVFMNYFWGVTLDPGYETENRIKQLPPSSQPSKTCEICLIPKAPCVHHCRQCARCVVGMDHHCPYLSNCVGVCNYRYFYLFLTWFMLGCWFATLMVFPSWNQCTRPYSEGFPKNLPVHPKCVGVGAFSGMFWVVFSGSFVVFLMWLFQTLLLLHSLTTFEWWANASSGQFSKMGVIFSIPSPFWKTGPKSLHTLVFEEGKLSILDFLTPYPPSVKLSSKDY